MAKHPSLSLSLCVSVQHATLPLCFNLLGSKYRLLLTGTPLQNNHRLIKSDPTQYYYHKSPLYKAMITFTPTDPVISNPGIGAFGWYDVVTDTPQIAIFVDNLTYNCIQSALQILANIEEQQPWIHIKKGETKRIDTIVSNMTAVAQSIATIINIKIGNQDQTNQD
eukprot:640664_1